MLKQLWASVAGLKTPERRLLFGLMLAIILVLWAANRDSESAKDKRIEMLEKQAIEKDRSKETMRIMMQDKIDQCAEEKFSDLKAIYEKTEKLKNAIKNMK